MVALREQPDSWNCERVAQWLRENEFDEYADLIAFTHKVDGRTLLQLREADFREPPLRIDCLGDIKRLMRAIVALRDHAKRSERRRKNGGLDSSHDAFVDDSHDVPAFDSAYSRSRTDRLSTSSTKDLVVCVEYDNHTVPVANCDPRLLAQSVPPAVINDLAKSHESGSPPAFARLLLFTREELIRSVESPDTEQKSMLKTIIALSYCLMSLLLTSFVMVFVHDRTPDMKTYPPLPDIVLDNLPLIPWAFEVCEWIAVTLSGIWFIVLVFHKHRIVIARRMFSLVGSVFLLRCVTMMITSMSVPGIHLECRAKSYGSFSAKLWEAYHIFSGLGMSIQGVRTCGDYMFSGHTTTVTLINHFITEYTPESWHTLHTTTWVLNCFGIFFILAGHEHYSIDVFIAFYISSRMFLYYHAYAYNRPNINASGIIDTRMRLWFPLGWFFEAGGYGRLENEYEIPFGYPDWNYWRMQWWSIAGYLTVTDKSALKSVDQERKTTPGKPVGIKREPSTTSSKSSGESASNSASRSTRKRKGPEKGRRY